MNINQAIRRAAVPSHTRSRREGNERNFISQFCPNLAFNEPPDPPPSKNFRARPSIWRSSGLPGSKEEMQASHWMIVICGGQKKNCRYKHFGTVLASKLIAVSKTERTRLVDDSKWMKCDERLVQRWYYGPQTTPNFVIPTNFLPFDGKITIRSYVRMFRNNSLCQGGNVLNRCTLELSYMQISIWLRIQHTWRSTIWRKWIKSLSCHDNKGRFLLIKFYLLIKNVDCWTP